MGHRFLLELLTEEIPVKEQVRYKQEAPVLIEKLLESERLVYEKIIVDTTPRRLILIIEKLAENQTKYTEEVAGPPVNIAFKNEEPTKATLGFLKKQNKKLSDVYRIKKGKKEYIAVKITKEAKPTIQILPQIAVKFVNGINWSKSMKWGNNDFLFSRPILGFTAKYGSETIVFTSHNKISNDMLSGHRFLSPKPFKLEKAENYEKLLEQHYVIISFEKRKEIIHSQLLKEAEAHHVTLIEDPALLNEVAMLIEEPHTVLGKFNTEFLAVPPEVILSAMRKHQRYFAFTGKNKLEPMFATVLGTKLDEPKVALAGNNRVLSARLSDATFFWNEDRKKLLESRKEKMKKMIYHRKLGTLWDKIERIIKLSEFFANKTQTNTQYATRAALLCKLDLETLMVYEFPELQGIMGSEYAKNEGEPTEVYTAIREHYKPAFSGDTIPTTKTGQTLALADKADTIIAGIAAGLKPTGSADPFALRRASLGLLRIILETEISMTFDEIIDFASNLLPLPTDKTECKTFLVDRLRTIFKQEASPEITEAVLSVENNNPLTAYKKLKAILEISDSEDFVSLVKLFKRMNILKKAENISTKVNVNLLKEPAEQNLYNEIVSMEKTTKQMFAKHNYTSALKTLIPLWKTVDEFFDDQKGVRVIADDPSIRNNRFALLFKLDSLFKQTADFKLLSGIKN